MIIVALPQLPARFNELAKAISGITDGILTDRLRELMAARLVEPQLFLGLTGIVWRSDLCGTTPARRRPRGR